jgi:hypothetical protein
MVRAQQTAKIVTISVGRSSGVGSGGSDYGGGIGSNGDSGCSRGHRVVRVQTSRSRNTEIKNEVAMTAGSSSLIVDLGCFRSL